MTFYTVFAWKASWGELWRIAGRKPLPFLIAIVLKLTRSKALEFAQPDSSAMREVPAGEIPPQVQGELAALMEEIGQAGYRLASVKNLEGDKSSTWGLFFLGPSGDRYLPLLAAFAKAPVAGRKSVRYALVSLDAAGGQVTTTYFPPQFDPAPGTTYMLASGSGIARLDRLHSGVLARRGGTTVPLAAANLGEVIARMENVTYDHLHARGIFSDRYEK